VLTGLLSAIAVTAAAPPPDRTFAMISAPAQSLMSITVPFLGVLLCAELHREDPRGRIASKLMAATCLAVLFALFGIVVSAVATAAAPGGGVGRWDDVGAVAVGSVLVQVTAQFIGTGLGMLVRSTLAAILATVVLTLGLWLILGAVDRSGQVQAWLTPYAAARNELSGQMDAEKWAQWTAVAMVWALGMNVAGAMRLSRRPR
jgi:hypothetical protein